MKTIKSKLLLCIFIISLFVPNFAYARNSDIPFYDGKKETLIMSEGLQMSGNYLRPGKFLPPNAPPDIYYTADLHYPALYNGSFDWGNQRANLVQSVDYSEPFVNVANDGYIGSGIPLGNRMITEVERVNSQVISQKYWGNPDFVLKYILPYEVTSVAFPKSYGKFYWIRDMAYLSGGMAGAGLQKDINKFNIFIVRTSFPDIKKFQASDGPKSNTVDFHVEGFEYVTKNKGYTDNNMGSETINPYAEMAGERNRVKWVLKIYKDGSEIDTKEGYIRSNPKKDSEKPEEGDAGYFGGKGSSSPIRWQPTTCGKFEAKLQVYDAVQRPAKEKKTSFTISGNGCDKEKPPTPGGEGDEDTFKYKMDFSVDRIEGETVESGDNVKTPVKVSRADFSEERKKYREELDRKIQDQERELSKLEDRKQDAREELNFCRYDRICTIDEEGNQHCVPRDCSSYEYNLDRILTMISTETKKLNKEKNKRDRLDKLESEYKNTTPNVVLRFQDNIVGQQKVNLSEGQSKVLYYDWKVPSSGQIEAEINPKPRKYDNSKDVLKTNFNNNKLDTPINVASHETSTCSQPNSTATVTAVVRTINNAGDRDTLYERLTGSIVNISKPKIRAGYGFSYEVKTTYTNEDSSSHATGVKSTTSFLPTMVKHQQYSKTEDGYKVPMDETLGGYNQVWSLPHTYVEKFSGNVFNDNYKKHPKYNPNETILDGGRKWYTEFTQADGTYSFKAMAYGAGVNKLNLCLTGKIEVEGSGIGDKKGNDDFIKRSVNPQNPFPGQVGWNWKNKEHMLTSLSDWWNTWKYPNPKDIPTGYHMESYKITPEMYKQIKEYNKTHGSDVNLNSDFLTRFNFK
ncbi:conjugal transfer protein [Bacillus cereus]|nr:conjugal transfer protein [Bacillus cereus]